MGIDMDMEQTWTRAWMGMDSGMDTAGMDTAGMDTAGMDTGMETGTDMDMVMVMVMVMVITWTRARTWHNPDTDMGMHTVTVTYIDVDMDTDSNRPHTHITASVMTYPHYCTGTTYRYVRIYKNCEKLIYKKSLILTWAIFKTMFFFSSKNKSPGVPGLFALFKTLEVFELGNRRRKLV
jgi:hypothetical protein